MRGLLIILIALSLYLGGCGNKDSAKTRLSPNPLRDVNSTSVDHILAEANSAYEAGNKDVAEQLYIQAAQKGSAEAHYSMCHKFTLPDEKYVFHLTKAARKGHPAALEDALGRFLIGGGLVGFFAREQQKAIV